MKYQKHAMKIVSYVIKILKNALFVKNHFGNQILEKEYLVTHPCIKISKDDIKISNTDNQNHICECPFLRLFITNYRDNISGKDENQEFLLSFPHNILLRTGFCIIFFFVYKQALLNNNKEFLNNRNQFYLEDVTELIAKKTNLIEEVYDGYYHIMLKYFNSQEYKQEGPIKESFIKKIIETSYKIVIDT